LIAGDVGHAALEQGLGHGENALAAEFLAGPQTELLDFLLEGTFRHRDLSAIDTSII
jgi:hypothetical protein